MGMPISLLARGESALEQDEAAQRVFAELRDVDVRFSLYQADSELSRLSRGELSLAQCHPDVREVKDLCDLAAERTGGLFDPRTPAGTWDPSGLVKGWAAERAIRHLAGTGPDWCLSAGGDVVIVSPSGEPFGIGIGDPRDPSAVVTVLSTTQSVATSGTAARGEHLYDPRTGEPARGSWLSVSITGPSLREADVLATAAFVAGPDWESLLLPGYAGLAVDREGGLHAKGGWPL
jgi:thiamine biosynthesis lipoprotein